MQWHELRHELMADYRIFSVERSIAVSPVDGSERTFFRIRSPDWVQIIPVTSSGEIVMVRQYRHGSQRATLEIPAGVVEGGEEPAAAALRECVEETGYRGPVAAPLGVLYPNPAVFANRLHAFVADGVERVAEIANTGSEHTTVELVPLRDVRARLRSGEIDHALCAAVLWRYLDALEAG
jgi:8-oxo-dGTP pyrophosphatase MutT (NUDIX family)